MTFRLLKSVLIQFFILGGSLTSRLSFPHTSMFYNSLKKRTSLTAISPVGTEPGRKKWKRKKKKNQRRTIRGERVRGDEEGGFFFSPDKVT